MAHNESNTCAIFAAFLTISCERERGKHFLMLMRSLSFYLSMTDMPCSINFYTTEKFNIARV